MLKSRPDRSPRRLPVPVGPGFLSAVAVAAVLVVFPQTAQECRADPLTRFIDGLLKRDDAGQSAPAASPAPGGTPAPADGAPVPQDPAAGRASPATSKTKTQTKAPPTPGPSRKDGSASDTPVPRKEERTGGKSTREAPAPATKATPARAAPPQRADSAVPAKSTVPSTPQEALANLNAHFNSIDQMTANFVQVGGDGQRVTGVLTLQRPGQFRFAYAAPSTLELVSDGRNVAIRDSKLHTNDVYPVGQTPLKFLVQDRFDLARATSVRSVQTKPDGIVTVKFEDTATLGGTSQVELTYNAVADKLVQWIVTDPQGYRTTVVLNDVNVIRRQSPGTD